MFLPVYCLEYWLSTFINAVRNNLLENKIEVHYTIKRTYHYKIKFIESF